MPTETEIIDRQFYLKIEAFEEDYPDQLAEYRLQKLEEELIDFIQRVVDDHTVSIEEENALLFRVAMKLLGHFHSRCESKLLRARLMARAPEMAS